jgi:excisionase family DNA binding protein
VKWLRVTTVARQFGCTSKRIRRMLKCGELDGIRLGNEWRVDHRSVDRLVRSRGFPEDAPCGAPSAK